MSGVGSSREEADVINLEVIGIVRAPVQKVFDYLVELENWPRWQSDMKESRIVAGERGKVGAKYQYLSKAMGQTFNSTVQLSRVEPGRLVEFEGEWVGMIRPNGAYRVEAVPEGSRVTLNPHPETRGFGSLIAPLMSMMIKGLNRKHLDALRQELEGKG